MIGRLRPSCLIILSILLPHPGGALVAEESTAIQRYVLDIDVESIDPSDALGDIIAILHENGFLADEEALTTISVQAGDSANEIFRTELRLPAITPKLIRAIELINPGLKGGLNRLNLGDVIRIPKALSRYPSTAVFSEEQRPLLEQFDASVPLSVRRDLWNTDRARSLVRVEGEARGTGFIVDGYYSRRYVATATHLLTRAIPVKSWDQCEPLKSLVQLFPIDSPSASLKSASCAYHLGDDVSLIPLLEDERLRGALPFAAQQVFGDYYVSVPEIYAKQEEVAKRDPQRDEVIGRSGQVVVLGRADGLANLRANPGMEGSPVVGPDGFVVGIVVEASTRSVRFKLISGLSRRLIEFVPSFNWADAGGLREVAIWGYNFRYKTTDLEAAQRVKEAIGTLSNRGIIGIVVPEEPASDGVPFSMDGAEMSNACGSQAEVSYLRLLPGNTELPPSCFKPENWPNLILIDQPVFDHEELSDGEDSLVAHWTAEPTPMPPDAITALFAPARADDTVKFGGSLVDPVTKRCISRSFKREFDHATHLATIIAGTKGGTGFSGILPGLKIVSIPDQIPGKPRLNVTSFKDLLRALKFRSENVASPPRIMLYASPFPSQADVSDTESIGPVQMTYARDTLRSGTYELADEKLRWEKHAVADRTRRDDQALWVVAAGQQTPRPDVDPSPVFLRPTTPQAPQNLGDLQNVIVVTACEDCGGVDDEATLWKWANRADEGYPEMVSLAAPGVDIPSAVVGSSYATTSGTSVAAAFVAGVASAMTACYPYYYSKRPALIKKHLAITGRPLLFRETQSTSESWQTVSSTVVVNPDLALRNLSLDWLVEGKDGDSKEIEVEGWCREQLPVERANGSKDSLATDEIRRIVRSGDKFVTFNDAGEPDGPFMLSLDNPDPETPILKEKDGDFIRLGLLHDLYLSNARETTSCSEQP